MIDIIVILWIVSFSFLFLIYTFYLFVRKEIAYSRYKKSINERCISDKSKLKKIQRDFEDGSS